MNMFLYVRERTSIGLDEIEEAINAALQGVGEVTGSGTGVSGSNIDIEILDACVDVSSIVQLIRNALATFNLPHSSVLVAQGVEYRLT